MQHDEKRKSKRENVRIAIILIVGIPILVMVYLHYIGGLNLPVSEISGNAIKSVKGMVASIGQDAVAEPEEKSITSSDAPFAPGSAGNLATMDENLKLKGQKLTYEAQRAAMKDTFREGKILVDEE